MDLLRTINVMKKVLFGCKFAETNFSTYFPRQHKKQDMTIMLNRQSELPDFFKLLFEVWENDFIS